MVVLCGFGVGIDGMLIPPCPACGLPEPGMTPMEPTGKQVTRPLWATLNSEGHG